MIKKFLAYILSFALFTGIIFITSTPLITGNETIPYYRAVSYISNNEVSEVRIFRNYKVVSLSTKDGAKLKSDIPNVEEFLAFVSNQLENGCEFEIKVTEDFNFGAFLMSVFDIIFGILLLVILFFVLRLPLKVGKKKEKTKLSSGDSLLNMLGGDDQFKIEQSKVNIKFDDVAGIEEVKEQIMDIIDYLKEPEKYKKMGAKLPKGILLSGEPGTGKTLLAKAMAGEAGVPFFQVSGSVFEEKYVGVGAARVRMLFEQAKKVAPAIIFIDEIDSVAKERYGEEAYYSQTLNQLLAQMDGFEENSGIVVIAATNHIEVLDSAIIRPGRFDRRITVPTPDVEARKSILELHAKNKPISSDVSFESIARRTVGFTGADLANILNEAAIYAVKLGKEYITNEAIDEAIARVLVGLKRANKVITAEEKHLSAIHEAGHAVVSAVLRPNVKNLCISIVPRGEAGGYNFFNGDETSYTKGASLESDIKVAYGGRAAEEVILGEISTGSSNDLKQANKIALLMANNYGMTGSLLVTLEGSKEYNKMITSRTLEVVSKICDDAYEETKNIVVKYSEQIQRLARILEEKEYMTEEEVADFMSSNI